MAGLFAARLLLSVLLLAASSSSVFGVIPPKYVLAVTDLPDPLAGFSRQCSPSGARLRYICDPSSQLSVRDASRIDKEINRNLHCQLGLIRVRHATAARPATAF